MADGHGGYRRPANPAAVSGPGQLSQRTDGAPHRMAVTDLPYGEAGALNALQSAAPLSAPSQPAAPPPSLGDPTAFPGQPVTSGADAGAGPTAGDIGLAQDNTNELRQKLGPILPVLMRMADASYADPKYKRELRQLMARINQ